MVIDPNLLDVMVMYNRRMETGPFYRCQYCGEEYVVKFTGKCRPCLIKDEEKKQAVVFKEKETETVSRKISKYKPKETLFTDEYEDASV